VPRIFEHPGTETSYNESNVCSECSLMYLRLVRVNVFVLIDRCMVVQGCMHALAFIGTVVYLTGFMISSL